LEFLRQIPAGFARNVKVPPALRPEGGKPLEGVQGLRWQPALLLPRGSPCMIPSLLWPSPGGFSGQVNPFLPCQGFATYLQPFSHKLSNQKTAVTGQRISIWYHQAMHSICTGCGLLPSSQSVPRHLDLQSVSPPQNPRCDQISLMLLRKACRD